MEKTITPTILNANPAERHLEKVRLEHQGLVEGLNNQLIKVQQYNQQKQIEQQNQTMQRPKPRQPALNKTSPPANSQNRLTDSANRSTRSPRPPTQPSSHRSTFLQLSLVDRRPQGPRPSLQGPPCRQARRSAAFRSPCQNRRRHHSSSVLR